LLLVSTQAKPQHQDYKEKMITETGDGSKTLYSVRFGEYYHSMFGARNESEHIFLNAGYHATAVNPVSVLEIGFGTGLNAFLTMMQAEKAQRATYYESVELYPVGLREVQSLSDHERFTMLHTAPWEKDMAFSPCFTLHKRKTDIIEAKFSKRFDVVYFDAFSPAVQPEMWTGQIFATLHEVMNSGAVLTTYCAKGAVRRMMQSIGFTVERLPGPKGKREMLRGVKK
jgi:tRNA U34 5-methylaminomethyl-2-thiouridine-forming methyltransferase MnmC